MEKNSPAKKPDKPEKQEKPDIHCSECSTKPFKKTGSYLRHLREKHAEKSEQQWQICPSCNWATQRPWDLTRHLITKHNLEPPLGFERYAKSTPKKESKEPKEPKEPKDSKGRNKSSAKPVEDQQKPSTSKNNTTKSPQTANRKPKSSPLKKTPPKKASSPKVISITKKDKPQTETEEAVAHIPEAIVVIIDEGKTTPRKRKNTVLENTLDITDDDIIKLGNFTPTLKLTRLMSPEGPKLKITKRKVSSETDKHYEEEHIYSQDTIDHTKSDSDTESSPSMNSSSESGSTSLEDENPYITKHKYIGKGKRTPEAKKTSPKPQTPKPQTPRPKIAKPKSPPTANRKTNQNPNPNPEHHEEEAGTSAFNIRPLPSDPRTRTANKHEISLPEGITITHKIQCSQQ